MLITSFAPSLMHKQYEILKQEFYIKPDLLIIYIDQTDIGDEFCRYKNKKIYSKNGKLKVLVGRSLPGQHMIILNYIYTLN